MLTLHRWAYELQRVIGQGGGHHREPTAKVTHTITGIDMVPRCEDGITRLTAYRCNGQSASFSAQHQHEKVWLYQSIYQELLDQLLLA